MSRNGWKAGRKIRKREWHEMESENMKKGALVAMLILWADAFVFIPLLFWITEEGIINEEIFCYFVHTYIKIIKFLKSIQKEIIKILKKI